MPDRTDPDLTRRLTAWSHGRQRLGRAGGSIGAVLDDIGGVYSVQPTAILSLAARVSGLDAVAYRRLDVDRSAVRISAMRSSGHLVPTDRAGRILSATRRPREAVAWVWRAIGLADAEYQAAASGIEAGADEPAAPRPSVQSPGAAQDE